MRICFVVHTFDKRDRGGVLRVISQLANQLVNYYDVDILSFGCVDEQAYKIDRRIKLISLNMMNYNTSYYNGLKKINWFREAFNCIYRKLSNDTIWITSSPPISLLFSLLKLRNEKLRVIGCDHTSTLYTKNFFIQKLRNFLLSRLDIMVALTPQDQEYYKSNGIKSVCIPNGIDLKNISKEHNNRRFLIYVGRLNEEKQPFKAIDFYMSSSLPKENIKMKIYGHGDYEQEVNTYINEHGLENFIQVIKGETDPSVIYKDAFALILTSKIEGFGLVLVEAMSRNIPCLSFEIPYGPLNIIRESVNGFFISDDGSDFDEKILLIKGLSLDEIHSSISEYDSEKVMKKWEKLILECYESI
ncbi:glycosyltransferase [Acinetobacter bereziniae]|uniref:glycosyltransferase n=1 Tax=Acinetobacter bereziniae TaxID=106648 RepID=UPI00125FA8D7|nr:glycosyltransferase [Acinetobacter bereziniae]MDA3440681.1 glycosyltransferase [Acinetobacter bereziniae]